MQCSGDGAKCGASSTASAGRASAHKLAIEAEQKPALSIVLPCVCVTPEIRRFAMKLSSNGTGVGRKGFLPGHKAAQDIAGVPRQTSHNTAHDGGLTRAHSNHRELTSHALIRRSGFLCLRRYRPLPGPSAENWGRQAMEQHETWRQVSAMTEMSASDTISPIRCQQTCISVCSVSIQPSDLGQTAASFLRGCRSTSIEG
jgi:hypothetical protein